MPNYLSVAKYQDAISKQYAALYDDQGEANETWMADDLDAAEGEIDAYLSTRYTTPITSGANAALLAVWTRILATRLAHFRKPAQKIPESLEKAYDNCIRQLEMVAEGKLLLGAATLPGTRSAIGDAVITDGNTPVMTRDDLEGF